jgi:hypothetical protein
VPEATKEIEAWKASAEMFAEWFTESHWADDPDDTVVIRSRGRSSNNLVTAGHIREVIKLCRTK